MLAKFDLTGRRFGRLMVCVEAGRKFGSILWRCECEAAPDLWSPAVIFDPSLPRLVHVAAGSENAQQRSVSVPKTDPNYGMASDTVWVDVPDEALITTPNRIGRTMVWPVWLAGADVVIRCFMPGSMT
jgi:hypothetical protein